MLYITTLLYYITQTHKLICEVRLIGLGGRGESRGISLEYNARLVGGLGGFRDLVTTYLFQILFLISAIYLTFNKSYFFVYYSSQYSVLPL